MRNPHHTCNGASEMNQTIEVQGRQFSVAIEYDDSMGEPWKEHDGHGVVSEWTTRDKRPGERVINQDGRSYRYYDFAATIKRALEEGWDAPPYGGRKRERAARAAEADFERMRGWCNDQWHWCGVVVTLLDDEGDETKEAASLWGIESDAGDYLNQVARELADEILARELQKA